MTALLSIAPMIDWTYSHFRYFIRLLAPQALLYTEMQTVGALRNNPARCLHFNPLEQPLAIQLGGADPVALTECAVMAEQVGYTEINLNLGCPSDKVLAGQFGACLMRDPQTVANCISAMKKAVSIPVTAKTRIGVDNDDSYAFFSDFAHRLVDAGADKLIVHARKAWLHGLNPKQNRTLPPVHYDYVYQLKQEVASIPVIINGNIRTLEEIKQHLQRVDGVMLGRLACENPYAVALIHHALYPQTDCLRRSQLLAIYLDYLRKEYTQGAAMSLLVKPLFNLAFGMPGASQWKQRLMALQHTKNLSICVELIQFMCELEEKLTIHGNLPEILVN